MDEQMAALADEISAADGVTVLTGAGVSNASGVPTFRGEEGIWNNEFDPADFRMDRFERDPAGFWTDRLELHERMFGDVTGPNDAHRALARLEDLGVVDVVVTQNTDGLHAEAGTNRLIELHGNNARSVCVECGESVPTETALDDVRAGNSPPSCPVVGCTGHLKPDVVLFGERLPGGAYDSARRMAWESDVFIVVGSSLTVAPASTLPEEAAERGQLAIFDTGETEKDHLAHYLVRGDATETLPALVEAVQARLGREADTRGVENVTQEG
ncbi:NAD-dependent deacetylase [Halogeometricum borinquense]|uniref:NAD-dependent deacetylase n=1 Tax=Halogeometricum borinquense TaxID=60847 RepID=A0A482TNF3_9EURY|nr:NAD-dependent deacetylase [Halogeometricum borinquense]RYJ14741.1 NAD-dependent deacetylase [Halogeometricum borinquense]